MEKTVSDMMSQANSRVDDLHAAASKTIQGVKDTTQAAAQPMIQKVNRTAVFNKQVEKMVSKFNS